eukprot:TRINITY_DN452_c0_g1_i1.p1 TRINITY_DN452_c0_g1~~TRINITY_DN452_c0_g1_i1.p1  ORF type:complete len:993 (+),score=115.47 TRINITY_DN452_c0_g1_i1:91-3069(+)
MESIANLAGQVEQRAQSAGLLDRAQSASVEAIGDVASASASRSEDLTQRALSYGQDRASTLGGQVANLGGHAATLAAQIPGLHGEIASLDVDLSNFANEVILGHLPGSIPPVPPEGISRGMSKDEATVDVIDADCEGAPFAATKSKFHEEDGGLTQDELRIIKARTMHEMVEDINKGSTKVLFLTNPQAELIAGSDEHLKKMLTALEVPKPSLVIRLLCSGGFRECCANTSENDCRENPLYAGMKSGRPPFESIEEEDIVDAKIDIFMMEVLIPLAERTNAIVLCTAVPCECILATSFTRMCKTMRGKWGGSMPFTVLSFCNTLDLLYKNEKKKAYWQRVRKQCRAWQQRDQDIQSVLKLQDRVEGPDIRRENRIDDLDSNATTIIFFDNIDHADPEKPTFDNEPSSKLMSELLRHLCTAVPSFAVKTGMSTRTLLGEVSKTSLSMPAELALGGIPVLCLDARQRHKLNLGKDIPQADIRERMIDAAKEQLLNQSEVLLKKNLAETFDVCSLAFIHDVLHGPTELDNNLADDALPSIPLHEAIESTKECEGGMVSQDGVTTAHQVADVSVWLAHRSFSDAWRCIQGRKEQTEDTDIHATVYRDRIKAFSTHARILLASPNMYTANLHDLEATKRVVNRIVKRDRLPSANPPEGLLLLRSAWCCYDVSMLLAGRYKFVCKCMYILLLLFGWFAISTSVVRTYLTGHPLVDSYPDLPDILAQVVFYISVAISLLAGMNGLVNPKARWRHLRSSAGVLQSAIWLYRTRVEPFELDDSREDVRSPEQELCQLLSQWRENLLAEAGMTSTTINKRHSAGAYKHFQFKGELADGADDFHSPTQPSRYIQLRIQPAIDFYQQRIPLHTRRVFSLELTIMLLGVLGSLLTYMEQVEWVAMSTALASALVAWGEFSDGRSKVERYSKAVTALENLLSWWDSLSDVQKAGRESINKLVCTAEGIISQEQLAWTSTRSKAPASEGRGGEAKDDKKKDAASKAD